MNESESENPRPRRPIIFSLWAGLCGGILLGGLTLTRLVVVKSQRIAMTLWDGVERAPSYSWVEILKIFVLAFGMGFVCGLIVRVGYRLSVRFGAIGDVLLGILVVNALLVMCLLVVDPEILTKKREVLLPLLGIATGLGTVCGFFGGRSIRQEIASEDKKPSSPRDSLE